MNVHNEMAKYFRDNLYKKGKLGFLITHEVSKKVFLELYEICVNTKEMIKIELLVPEEKEKLRSECLGTGLKFTNREMNNACRILHTLKNI